MPLVVFLFLTTLVGFRTPLHAGEATLYAVHGIPGTALGAPTTDLAVDVAGNGACVGALNSFNFGEIRGPLTLPAPASYTIEIKPANSLTPCANATLLSTQAALGSGANVSLVAHLSAAGLPMLTAFANDISATAAGQGRLILHHTAQAPAVDARLFRGDGAGKSPAALVPGFANGAQIVAEFRPGDWQATLSVGSSVVFGPATLTLQPRTVQLVYAVGIFPDSFTLLSRTIPAVR